MLNDDTLESSRRDVIAIVAALQDELAQDSSEVRVILLTFPVGQIVATPGALDALEDAKQSLSEFLTRHCARDWGELDAEDSKTNDEALQTGERLLSAYQLANGQSIWIITEADRSATTALLPSEY